MRAAIISDSSRHKMGMEMHATTIDDVIEQYTVVSCDIEAWSAASISFLLQASIHPSSVSPLIRPHWHRPIPVSSLSRISQSKGYAVTAISVKSTARIALCVLNDLRGYGFCSVWGDFCLGRVTLVSVSCPYGSDHRELRSS